MDLPDYEGNPYLPVSDRLTKAGVCCLLSMCSLLFQKKGLKPLNSLRMAHLSGKREKADKKHREPQS